jgi:nucleotide-binding universal stress UspA family protein
VSSVPASLFERVVVPVANREDAAATAAALAPYVEDAGGTVVAVHVVEKAGGAPDKASVEQREQRAEDVFAIVEEGLADTGVPLEFTVLYGTDVAKTIIDGAHDADATSIVFTPRGGSRWAKLLTGDVTHHLVAESDLPVLVLPDEEVTDR